MKSERPITVGTDEEGWQYRIWVSPGQGVVTDFFDPVIFDNTYLDVTDEDGTTVQMAGRGL